MATENRTNRVILIDIEIWEETKKKVRQDGLSVSSLIRLFLKEYVKGNLSPNIEGR